MLVPSPFKRHGKSYFHCAQFCFTSIESKTFYIRYDNILRMRSNTEKNNGERTGTVEIRCANIYSGLMVYCSNSNSVKLDTALRLCKTCMQLLYLLSMSSEDFFRKALLDHPVLFSQNRIFG
jgi:hypothetical protein